MREASQRVIVSVASGEIDAVTDAEVFQEILYRYLNIGQRARGLEVFDNFHRIMMGRILPIEDADVIRARGLVDLYTALSPRDLIHLAVMLRNQIAEIVTADKGFNGIAGVHPVDPSEFLAQA